MVQGRIRVRPQERRKIMDPTRFDSFTRMLGEGRNTPTRRGLLVLLGGGIVASVAPALDVAAKKHKKHKKHKHRGGSGGGGGGGGGGGECDPPCGFNTVCENGACVAAENICNGPTGICNADPTPCGHAATGETCGCELTVEGNNVCVNGVDACPNVVECTSSQDCRDTLGFHFFCQEAKTNAQGNFCGCGFGTATGKVCVAECDNTD
jgi:hypothetical protein